MTGVRIAAGALALTVGVLVAGCTGPKDGRLQPAPFAGGDGKLVPYTSCAQALQELKRAAAPYVGPYGFAFRGAQLDEGAGEAADGGRRADAPAAPGPGGAKGAEPDHSGTNVHEQGVDEPDLVKTDGRRIVTVTSERMFVVSVADRQVTGSVPLATSDAEPSRATQLLLAGDRALIVMPQDRPTHKSGPGAALRTHLVLFDIAGAPRELSRLTVDGVYLDARLVKSTARVVTHSVPQLRWVSPDARRTPEQATAQNRAVLEDSTVADWLPRYRLTRDGRTQGGALGCTQLAHPARYTATSLLSVLTFDLGSGVLDTRAAVSLAADGRTVYGTGTSLYVANDQRAVAEPAPRSVAAPQPQTEIYWFDTSGTGAPRYLGSGAVPGWLLNQYSLSEHDGHLRVATTQAPDGGTNRTESAVFVLAQRGDRLAQVGHVGGLGKGERIFAVRFVGTTGYVVTFRQTDPLYVLDLRKPAAPAVTGELKITGYSAYLHPISGTRLLGVGQEATEQGRVTGLQVSLFDVADPAAPRRISQFHEPRANSRAEQDPHAFLYWEPTGLVAMPVYGPGRTGTDQPERSVTAMLVLKLTGDSLTEIGAVSHPEPAGVERALVIGNDLWTVSDAGVKAVDATTLAVRAWVPFGP